MSPTDDDANPAAVSVDLVFDQVLRSVESQHANLKSIDEKASFILASATLVMGLTSLAIANTSDQGLNTVWLAPAGVLYFIIVLSVFGSYRSRDHFGASFLPKELQEYLFDSKEYTKRQFIAAMRLTYEGNDATVKAKGKWLRISEVMFLVQVAVVVTSLLVAGNVERVDRILSCVF